jgi:hypothetical protein
MKRSCLALAALAALVLLPATRAVAAPVLAHTDNVRTSSVIPPEYCFGVFGEDYEKYLCSDGSGARLPGGLVRGLGAPPPATCPPTC